MVETGPQFSTPRHAVIVAHPESHSFTMAVADAYCEVVRTQGQVAIVRDLYRLGFDPVLKASERPTEGALEPATDVAAELEQLHGSDVFVLVYPIWFGAPPAIMKGYIDRVFGAGYVEPLRGEHLLGPAHPLLGGKRLLSITSSGSTRRWLDEQGAWLSLQTLFDGYLARSFWMDTPDHLHFESIVEGLGKDIVRGHLAEVRMRAGRMCDRLSRELA